MAQNHTLEVSQAFANLATVLALLPPSLDATSLARSLESWSHAKFEPFVPSLVAIQQQELILQAALTADAGSQAFVGLLEQIPAADRGDASAETLREIVKLGVASTSFDIECWWAPEVFAIAIMFALAIYFKVGKVFLLSRRATSRVRRIAENEENKSTLTVDEARVKLLKSAQSILGHLANLVLSTVCIALQCLAWRLFVLPTMPLRLQDIRYLSFAMKLLATGYAADLLFGDVHMSIYAHHLFTFALLLVGQLAAFETGSPKFFRMAQYLILQATLEQTTYGAMVAWHTYKWLALQNPNPSRQTPLQRKCLWISYALLRITQATTYPQKCLPIVFAWYWGARMWHQVDDIPFGRFWLAWFALLASLLLVLQLKFIDETWPLTAHVRYTLHGGQPPSSRSGPVMRRLMRCLGRRDRGTRTPSLARPSRDSSMTFPASPVSTVGGSSIAKHEVVDMGGASPVSCTSSRATTVVGTRSPKRSHPETAAVPNRPPVSQIFGSQQSFLTFGALLQPEQTAEKGHVRPRGRSEPSSISIATSMTAETNQKSQASTSSSTASSSAVELDQMPTLSAGQTAVLDDDDDQASSRSSVSVYLDNVLGDYDNTDDAHRDRHCDEADEGPSIARLRAGSPSVDAASVVTAPSRPASPSIEPFEFSIVVSEMDLDACPELDNVSKANVGREGDVSPSSSKK